MPQYEVRLKDPQYQAWRHKVGEGRTQPIQRVQLSQYAEANTHVLVGLYKGEATGTGYAITVEHGVEVCVGSLNVSAMEARAGQLQTP